MLIGNSYRRKELNAGSRTHQTTRAKEKPSAYNRDQKRHRRFEVKQVVHGLAKQRTITIANIAIAKPRQASAKSKSKEASYKVPWQRMSSGKAYQEIARDKSFQRTPKHKSFRIRWKEMTAYYERGVKKK